MQLLAVQLYVRSSAHLESVGIVVHSKQPARRTHQRSRKAYRARLNQASSASCSVYNPASRYHSAHLSMYVLMKMLVLLTGESMNSDPGS